MRHPVSLVLLAPLFGVGCFAPMPPDFAIDTIGYSTVFTDSDAIVFQPFTYDELTCPDGGPATFYAVYRTDLTEPAPFVVFFHSGAFDFVLNPGADDPLAGNHYQSESRLTSQWAASRVSETLGLITGDGSENNLGTLPAALADAGAFTLYPANCWGDLWHNEFGFERNEDGDGFYRNGRFLAWAMVGLASPDAAVAQSWQRTLGLETFPIDVDLTSVALVGLGEGGRAPVELLRREQTAGASAAATLPPIRGILIDSTADNLLPIASDDVGFKLYNDGLQRIFPDQFDGVSDAIDYYSLFRYYQGPVLEGTLQVVWSSNDPQVPNATLDGLNALATAGTFGTNFKMTDTGDRAHVFLNADQTRARDAVGTLLGLR